MLRPIRPDDAGALVRAFARLTPEQVRLCVFHTMTELPLPFAAQMCAVDPATTTAFVAADADGTEIRGEARIHVDPATEAAEFALIIDPAYTGQSVGRALLRRLIDAAERPARDPGRCADGKRSYARPHRPSRLPPPAFPANLALCACRCDCRSALGRDRGLSENLSSTG